MKAVVQRVSRAAVRVEGEVVAEIGRGLLVLLGFGKTDSEAEADWMIEKLLALRIFPDDTGKMAHSVADIAGEMLIVSQFTLTGELRKGTRPDFSDAMPPVKAEPFYRAFMAKLRDRNGNRENASRLQKIAEGRFGATMEVDLVNEGPVTIVLERHHPFSEQGATSRSP